MKRPSPEPADQPVEVPVPGPAAEQMDVEALRKAAAAFTKQRDRGAVLIAAAWLDDALEVCLRASFRADERTIRRVLNREGALGPFSARINVAYLLGVVEPTAWRDLEIIRKIRNDFAHTREDVRFATPSVRDRCANLHAMHAWEMGAGDKVRSPRERFLLTAVLLGHYLLSVARVAKPLRDGNGDSYGSWIRRTVKTMTLANALEALRGEGEDKEP